MPPRPAWPPRPPSAGAARVRRPPRRTLRLLVTLARRMTSPTPRRLLLFYHWPPAPVNSARSVTMAKYLRRRGHHVRVLTSAAFGGLPEDAEETVTRSADLVASPALRRLLRRPALTGAGAPGPAGAPAPPGLVTDVVVPDPTLVSWAPGALRAARRIVRRESIDCVICSSPPESSTLLGLALSRHAAWLIEFRDPWRFKPSYPLALQRAADRRLERLVTERADGVVALQHAAAEDLERRYGREVRAIPNGWDPDIEEDEVQPDAVPAREPGTVRLVHTGTLSGDWGRSPEALFEGLLRLREREPE